MTIYAALLFGLTEVLHNLVDRRMFLQRYASEVAYVTRLSSGSKAEAFQLAIACSEFSATRSAKPVWAETARLIRELIDNGSDDYQIFSLHSMLLQNPTYKATFTAEMKLAPLEEAIYDDDAALTKDIGEVEN